MPVCGYPYFRGENRVVYPNQYSMRTNNLKDIILMFLAQTIADGIVLRVRTNLSCVSASIGDPRVQRRSKI